MIEAVKNHPRSFENNRYVYPVVSRRSKGLSIGINMNPDKFCNFDCVYCQVDRTQPGISPDIDIDILCDELRGMLELYQSGELARHPNFRDTPADLLRLNDVALSGDGEPTLCKNFTAVCECADLLRHQPGRPPFKLVLITNATGLHRHEVQRGLDLFSSTDEIWAKLDAGTDAYLQKIDRTGLKLEPILQNILMEGRKRPVVIQSLFLEFEGKGPDDAEIRAYIERLAWLKGKGCRIQLVQVYSIARPPAESSAKPLPRERLDQITDKVRDLGLSAETY